MTTFGRLRVICTVGAHSLTSARQASAGRTNDQTARQAFAGPVMTTVPLEELIFFRQDAVQFQSEYLQRRLLLPLLG